jgi:hypothetical protein
MISNLFKKVVKFPKGDLYTAKIHNSVFYVFNWIAHTSMSWSQENLSRFIVSNFIVFCTNIQTPQSHQHVHNSLFY